MPKKCLRDNMFAMTGSDYCRTHSGRTPRIQADGPLCVNPNQSYPQVDNNAPIGYDRNMTTNEHEPEANIYEAPIYFGEPNPVRVYPTVRKDLLKERIETKIEEFRESIESNGNDQTFEGLLNIRHDRGTINGLKLALDILEES